MAKFALIGYPAAGSLSPALFSAAYAGRHEYGFIEEEKFEVAWDRFMAGDYKAVNVTAPHKISAAQAASWQSPEVEAIGAANILVKTERGVEAYNSDYLGVKRLIEQYCPHACTAVVVGFGGAGKAAFEAALSCGLETIVKRHDQISDGIFAELVIYTLPKAVEGIDKIHCRYLIEANYRTPVCADLSGVRTYIDGKQWLKSQAITGYEIMTGEAPDEQALEGLTI